MDSKGKLERGLEELGLNLMMDIEPIDPPAGLRDKIMSTTEKSIIRGHEFYSCPQINT